MAVTKKKKQKDYEIEDAEMIEDDETPTYTSRAARSNPPYLLIVLLMAVSFFAGYTMFRITALEKLLADTRQAPTGGVAGAQNAAAPQKPTELKIKKPEESDHSRGNANARYVWVEYSDYECPFCKRNHPDLVKLMGENSEKVRWVYRHFPLQFHPKAQKSAEATECAAELGGNDAFWKLTDLIFERMPDMELTALPGMAAEIGLDQNAFQTCLDSGKETAKVTASLNEGSKAGVAATPTGVIYDMKTGKTQLVEGALPYDNLKQELENFMAANK